MQTAVPSLSPSWHAVALLAMTAMPHTKLHADPLLSLLHLPLSRLTCSICQDVSQPLRHRDNHVGFTCNLASRLQNDGS
eukprot:NODE_2954_length_516_cov_82.346895_g2555_i0.p3 GENE.NODE_2954_length_516_cov_82.346895_g2555_i0~~NODE_2954_length_516_cov_82.346895_g2555_i0.p3  ORF type:complete len:79 (-),score=1.18 NODE_2954_length_516_cov_82.346895_g2555_i0:191-427(-)